MANLPSISQLPYPGSDYAPSLSEHWRDQVPEVYKKRWQKVVLDKDDGGIRFSRFLHWPTVYYNQYQDTYGSHSVKHHGADKLFGDSSDMSRPHQLQ